ncbi:MAG: hypothetical protein M3552_19075 [Planctomycetota bacterium]|nr:hypothetical protein [Planctomycetaceae bacterium]MDQ3332719.1 hypothetical protein [Planctomycetota bacterium]
MSHPNTAATNGHAGRTHFTGAARTVDWSGYPALFQRVAPNPRPTTSSEAFAQPAPAASQARGLREAFLGFCQASLFSPGTTLHIDRPSEAAAAAKAIAAAEAFGFTRDEIHRLGCGLYSSPAAMREDLRGVGFADAEIDAARLTSDEAGRPRAEFAGGLVVPLTDETGQLCDFLFLTVGENGKTFCGYRFLDGPAKSRIVAYGLQAALSRPMGRESLILVDGVLDCLLLQCRGVHSVAAIGTSGQDFSPRRWEELSRLGVAEVTLAFSRDDRHSTAVRDALVNALRARTAPEVFIAEPYPAGERSAADVLRRFGKDTCAVALATRSLAFHHKDFGAADRVRSIAKEVAPRPAIPQPQPVAAIAAPHHRDAYRRHVADLAAALPIEDRSAAEQVIAAFDAAIVANDLTRASWAIHDFASSHSSYWPTYQPSFPAPMCPPSAGHQSSSVSSVGAVLDRLTKTPQPGEIPGDLNEHCGGEATSAIEWIVDHSSSNRLATLCERLADALERRPQDAFVVACCEHTPRQVVLALTTELASRLSEGAGLSMEEVRSRLAGVEPAGGYRDKPWLVDEAADRLRLCSSRLTFVACPTNASGWAAVEQAAETARGKTAIGGIYFNGMPSIGWQTPYDVHGADWLNRFASKCVGPVTVATAQTPISCSVPFLWRPAAPICWPLTQTAGGMAVLSALREWLNREADALSI